MDRFSEVERYKVCYNNENYKMGQTRYNDFKAVLKALQNGNLTSFLDVGCGRGESLQIATDCNFKVVKGVDPATYNDSIINAYSIDIPFNDKFDVVSCLDVLEHLIEDDIIPTLNEINRLANKFIILTYSDKPSYYRSPDGKDLHISKRPQEDWETLVKSTIPGRYEFRNKIGVSPGVIITL